MSTFWWVSYRRNVLITISYHCFYQKHCLYVVRLIIEIIYCLFYWFGNIFYGSKKVSIYIWFNSTMVFWSNRFQEVNFSHIIIFFVYWCQFYPNNTNIEELQIQCIVCVIYSTRVRRHVIIYDWTQQYFFAHIESNYYLVIYLFLYCFYDLLFSSWSHKISQYLESNTVSSKNIIWLWRVLR